MTDEFTPVIIILSAVYWTKAESGLSIATAFTSIALISIVSGPVMLIIVSFMQLATALGCFTRLQTFLLQDDRVDGREIIGASAKSSLSAPRTAQTVETRDDVELVRLPAAEQRPDSIETNESEKVVSLRNACLEAGEDARILHDVNLDIHRGTLNMVVGRVGCGKSSLLKAIIGELCLASGSITVNVQSMAYCDQIPWLQNISIRHNIAGQTPMDEEWLKTVLYACALDEDVAHLALGDRSIVGTGGVALSGGQKQRVVSHITPERPSALLQILTSSNQALARAIFARKRLVLLDDVFSGLDSKTARAVFNRVLGPEGLLRKSNTTVILVTHNSMAREYPIRMSPG
jgi:ABC-type multidrug transport system fused ATPase/permease subunit